MVADCPRRAMAAGARSLYTTAPGHDGVLLYLTLFRHAPTHVGLAGRTWTHTRSSIDRGCACC
jgi:hypothetical protein